MRPLIYKQPMEIVPFYSSSQIFLQYGQGKIFLGTEENIFFCEIIPLCVAVDLRFVSDINAFNHFGG